MTPPSEIDLDWLRREATCLFQRHRVTVERGKQRSSYHAPSPQQKHARWRFWGFFIDAWRVNYPHQWFWDSCAHAVVLSHLDLGRAKQEVLSLLFAQRHDGFIPHLIWSPRRRHWAEFFVHRLYPDPIGSPYLQPPALAEAVEAIREKEQDTSFLQLVLPGLVAYYEYLDRERNLSGDGLLEIFTSYESGKDRSPEYDSVYGTSSALPIWRGPLLRLTLRHSRLGWDSQLIARSQRFRVKDLLFNCVYAANLHSLARLQEQAGDQDAAGEFHLRALQTEATILTKMFHPPSGLFFSLDARWGRDAPLAVPTISSLFPLLLYTIDQEKVSRLLEHLGHPEAFWLPYPVPAVPGQVPVMERIIWRGSQTWIYPNWFLVRGLLRQGERFPELRQECHRLATEITLRSYRLVRQQGFREFYDSHTGRGLRAQDFAWSTLVLDMVERLRGTLTPSIPRSLEGAGEEEMEVGGHPPSPPPERALPSLDSPENGIQ